MIKICTSKYLSVQIILSILYSIVTSPMYRQRRTPQRRCGWQTSLILAEPSFGLIKLVGINKKFKNQVQIKLLDHEFGNVKHDRSDIIELRMRRVLPNSKAWPRGHSGRKSHCSRPLAKVTHQIRFFSKLGQKQQLFSRVLSKVISSVLSRLLARLFSRLHSRLLSRVLLRVCPE